MKRVSTLFFPLLLLFGLAGCLPRETPIPLFISSANIDSVQMGSTYNQQIFYSLSARRIVSQNLKTDWDLAFESGSNGMHIAINNAKAMYVWPSSCRDMNWFRMSDTLARRWDATNGRLAETAMYDWQDTPRRGTVYVINRGLTATNRAADTVLFQILLVDAVGYEIMFRNIRETSPKRMRILKDNACNFTFLSLEGGAAGSKVVRIEPPRNSWDIVFTQYTHYFADLAPPNNLHYTVTGCLLNRYVTRAGRPADTTRSFEEIDLSTASNSLLRDSVNVIGYDWKQVDINTSHYTVNPKKCYIISSSAGKLYKFHFIGFTTAAGVNGMPRFEYQEL